MALLAVPEERANCWLNIFDAADGFDWTILVILLM
jgi:hypothetical protein